MCDTLCAVLPGGTLFAKSSDRPPHEVQLVELHDARPAGDAVRTQYLTVPDEGAAALLGARPQWLWGMEHAVNEHGVAIGNERLWTLDDASPGPPAMIGMDLVRLVAERARNADHGVDVLTTLLERHGQGGVAVHDQPGDDGEVYSSAFLVADPHGGWVIETCGPQWAAERVDRHAAISNRLTLRPDWADPGVPVGHADLRLAASTACLARGPLTPGDLVAHLRDHGNGPWGAPGAPYDDEAAPLPRRARRDGTGVTVCMHVRGHQATTSSIVAWLPADDDEPARAWVAAGSPCVSVYVPVLAPRARRPGIIPPSLADSDAWRRGAALRDRVEADSDALVEIRAALDPLEAELWAEADELGADPEAWGAFVAMAEARVADALDRLAAAPTVG